MLYTCDVSNQFFIKPITRVLENGIEIATWKNDEEQEFFNFEIQLPLAAVREDFRYDSGGYFMDDYGDSIDCIGTVQIKDELLIISGWKMKGN
jgi:hypothetical protein